MLADEADKVKQRERTINDLVDERERVRMELENQLGAKSVDYDNLKRAYDELAYEHENLRRILNAKQEEIAGLN